MTFRTLGRRLYDLWMRFAHVLGWINGRIILTVLYLVVIGPYAIVRRMARMFRKPSPQTYWVLRQPSEPTLESLRRIFS